MIKIFLISIFFISSAFAAQRIPEKENGFEYGMDFRLLKKKKRFIMLAESKNREEKADSSYHQLMLGSYYRLTKRLRLGLFLQGESGLRWDNDWEKKNVWGWKNINNQKDFSSVADLTYNDLLASNLTWELKNRILYYHSRQALLLKLRPGLRYFILKHGLPQWQLYSEVEGYFPINYGTETLYEYWVYVGGLYQVTPKFSIGPVVSYRKRWFHSYDSFKDTTGDSYRVAFSTVYLGLSAVYNW